MAETTTLVRRQAGLLDDLREVLERHAAGAAFRLIYAAAVPTVAEDEVLVQQVNPLGVLELRPVAWTALAGGDVLHDTQVIDPADAALGSQVIEASGPMSCIEGPRKPNGGTSHLYGG